MTMLRYTGGRHTSGYSVITDPYAGDEERETVSCAHCQKIWMVQPGSGTKRGFCFRCNAPLCGKKGCMEKCVPFEKAIEQMEARGRLFAQLERMKG